MTQRLALALTLCLGWLGCPQLARADVQRFAILVGNDHGHADDAALRYAGADAAKVYGVLRDLGGFAPANMVLLRDEDANTFRSTLIAVNDRIRSAAALPNTQTLLFVYYSGHADASELHLGPSRFALTELAQLVRGSAATFRLLVLDACRSGALTRVKGGHPVAAFALPAEPGLGEEGLAFLTASSANEDAQESDELRGSFFTHAFVSGLLGAADSDGDGTVVLEEAYRHAYDATLRATSRSFAGTQHPTFSYDFRGQAALVLTQLGGAGAARARLRFPSGIGFLVLREHAAGAVVAELGADDKARTLSLRPGAYFVRGRGQDALLEGELHIAAGESREVDPSQLSRVQYARLVRKGARASALAHGPELGATLRSQLPGSRGACPGLLLGYRLELQNLSLVARAAACSSGFDNAVLQATTRQADLSLAALHAWDLPWVSLALGLGAGAAYFDQHFDTPGRAPARQAVSPFVLVAGAATFELGRGFYTALDLRAETHFQRVQASSREQPELTLGFALRSALVLGKHF